ncbi:UNVERIFIED_CONTAM: hypothetical protein Sindi_1983400 [Sesamum indicum]
MIEEYLKQMQNDLKKNLSGIASPMEASSKNGENKLSCLAGESQNPLEKFSQEEFLDNVFKGIRETLKEKSKMEISESYEDKEDLKQSECESEESNFSKLMKK